MEFDCSKARSEQNSNGTFRFGQDEGTDQAQCALTLDLQNQSDEKWVIVVGDPISTHQHLCASPS
ncbi:hypothetical protein AAP_05896 [Ascosphaera apis ARSEF 7405]|uniref:Uncharacterized protein n=1 Tax=Ascosphaera apis ARSEF 7405 TaxID=392613 RepID=A0A167V741_9EURO|nr:hypothetical protein AAP_05896 [Ascosphaera apis ARSEF 7405]